MKDNRLYILMRTDLQSMTPGRAMAQASHASNAFIHKHGGRPDVKEWQRQTKQGFGTVIVLAASKRQIENIFDKLEDCKIKEWVVDPDYVIKVSLEIADLMHQNYDGKFCSFQFDYSFADDKTTFITRSERTCAYIFGTKESLEPHLSGLNLHP